MWHCLFTYNPSTAICSHITVYLYSLAEIPIKGNGVNATQIVAIDQMLGTVLRIHKYTASCRLGQ